ncbi:PadR family transcriptional regulator [Caballeronia sp. HLA56]
MKNKSLGRLPSADPLSDEGTPRHCPHHGKRHHGRLFDYGELRLLLLAMISERPRHGYELIKAIEERMEGRYTPSPGVMYPTLAWLDDMGYAAPLAKVSSRKCYRITAEGQAFLVANRAAADGTLVA